MNSAKHMGPITRSARVTSTRFCQSKYSNPGYGTNWFTLECGHDTFAKSSEGEPSKKRCRECFQRDNGRDLQLTPAARQPRRRNTKGERR